jgi:hypothetical protein
VEEVVGEADIGRLPPLNTCSPPLGGLSRYSDWVIQCANEIYIIMGILYMGHKLQLLALLTFLEEEHCLEALGDWSSYAMKGKREVKNLES